MWIPRKELATSDWILARVDALKPCPVFRPPTQYPLGTLDAYYCYFCSLRHNNSLREEHRTNELLFLWLRGESEASYQKSSTDGAVDDVEQRRFGAYPTASVAERRTALINAIVSVHHMTADP